MTNQSLNQVKSKSAVESAQAARLVHLNSIPNWQQLLVLSFGLAGARLGTQAERRFGRRCKEANDHGVYEQPQ